VGKVFFFLPYEIRLFLAKDIKVFVRDRLQWSQFLIFFGVLAIYIANIRSLPYNLTVEAARAGISLLNLAATCLVLSTSTGRFIFPLLSLEGRNFWVLGLAPINRSRILYGKFFFAFFGSLAISEVLIFLSDWMLSFPLTMWLGHAVIVLAICSGLAAISVGLGARYPNLKEDNPAKIVAGFGGTLNLIVSMFYIAVMIAAIGYPYQMAFAARETAPMFYHKATAVYLVLAAAAGALTSVFFLNIGRAQFERMEM
jgi:ABC-2 type transport system permease protein